jgi:urea transport system ATP-binding protein
MLNVSSLSAGYDDSIILQNVNCQVKQGQVVALLGRNGVGKTTLVKTIVGLLKQKSGNIEWDGTDLTEWRPDERAKQGIGYVPQGRDIFSTLTVEENLLLGLEALPRLTKKRGISEEVFEWFPVLKEMLHRKGGDLSGGQQQQLAIARVLVSHPQLICLDEPMEGIQPSIVQLIQEVIVKIAKQKQTGMLLVEHNVDLALECADYVYVMDRGTIVAEGETSSFNVQELEKHLVV